MKTQIKFLFASILLVTAISLPALSAPLHEQPREIQEKIRTLFCEWDPKNDIDSAFINFLTQFTANYIYHRNLQVAEDRVEELRNLLREGAYIVISPVLDLRSRRDTGFNYYLARYSEMGSAPLLARFRIAKNLNESAEELLHRVARHNVYFRPNMDDGHTVLGGERNDFKVVGVEELFDKAEDAQLAVRFQTAVAVTIEEVENNILRVLRSPAYTAAGIEELRNALDEGYVWYLPLEGGQPSSIRNFVIQSRNKSQRFKIISSRYVTRWLRAALVLAARHRDIQTGMKFKVLSDQGLSDGVMEVLEDQVPAAAAAVPLPPAVVIPVVPSRQPWGLGPPPAVVMPIAPPQQHLLLSAEPSRAVAAAAVPLPPAVPMPESWGEMRPDSDDDGWGTMTLSLASPIVENTRPAAATAAPTLNAVVGLAAPQPAGVRARVAGRVSRLWHAVTGFLRSFF